MLLKSSSLATISKTRNSEMRLGTRRGLKYCDYL